MTNYLLQALLLSQTLLLAQLALADICMSSSSFTQKGKTFTLCSPTVFPEWQFSKPIPVTPEQAVTSAKKSISELFIKEKIAARDIELSHVELKSKATKDFGKDWYYEISFRYEEGEPSIKKMEEDNDDYREDLYINTLVLLDGSVVTPTIKPTPIRTAFYDEDGRSVPFFSAGKPEGIKLFALKENGVWIKSGFSEGDIIKKIDGIAIVSLEQVREIFIQRDKRILSSKILITRDGKDILMAPLGIFIEDED